MSTAGGVRWIFALSPASAMLAWPVMMFAISLTALLESFRTSAGSLFGSMALATA